MGRSAVILMFVLWGWASPATPAPALVLSAAPVSEPGAAALEQAARWLGQRLGRSVRYRRAPDWPTYFASLRRKRDALVLDEAHFALWRMRRRGYVPLVRAAGRRDFIVFIRRGDLEITEYGELAGRRTCAPPWPRLPGMAWRARFTTTRKPPLVASPDSRAIFAGVLARRCAAGIVPTRDWRRRQGEPRQATRPVYQTPSLPGPTVLVAAQVAADLRAAVTTSLTTLGSYRALAPLREYFMDGRFPVTARAADFAGLEYLLGEVDGLMGVTP